MKVITIGRDESNDIVIADDPHASRHHLQIIQHDDGHFTLKDFGSTNGTSVNGNRVYGEIPLDEMDIVRIGSGNPIPWREYFYSDNQVSYSSPHYSASAPAANPTLVGEEEPPLKKKTVRSLAIVALIMGIVCLLNVAINFSWNYLFEFFYSHQTIYMIMIRFFEIVPIIGGLALLVLSIIVLKKSSINMISK